MPRTYTVKQGDNLWSIAKSHDVDFAEIKKANPALKARTPPYSLYPGDQVIIPDEKIEDTASGLLTSEKVTPNSTSAPMCVPKEAKTLCCPEVAIFEGPSGGLSEPEKYFGFDPKTNLAEEGEEYWIPADKKKSLPSSKETRDGARWASVAVNEETTLEIAFDDEAATGCIANSEFVMSETDIIEVLTTKICAQKAEFRIKGLKEGECSIEAKCNGKTLGYVHVACFKKKKMTLNVGTILSQRARKASYDKDALSQYVNEIYRQACITVKVNDIGVIDLTDNEEFDKKEKKIYNWCGDFRLGLLSFIVKWRLKSINRIIESKLNETLETAIKEEEYYMYFYIPKSARSGGTVGIVIDIGESPGFVFDDLPNLDYYNVLAHELGHSLGLEHPAHNKNKDQFAKHMLDSLNKQVPEGKATNTEPAYKNYKNTFNVMAIDPLNLMGYWWDMPVCKLLRYHQWNPARAKLKD